MGEHKTREETERREVTIDLSKIRFAIKPTDRENIMLRDYGEVADGACQLCRRPCGHERLVFRSERHEQDYYAQEEQLQQSVPARIIDHLLTVVAAQIAVQSQDEKKRGLLPRRDSRFLSKWQSALIDDDPIILIPYGAVTWAVQILDSLDLPVAGSLSQWREAAVECLENVQSPAKEGPTEA